uniref:FBA_2 domain-containing protein n=1 Tax=Caenorhabditis tropicalis TaxID=1561998 RepID=A0A1I7TI32_9PELO
MKRSVISFSRVKPRFSLTLRLIEEPDIIIRGNENKWSYVWIQQEVYPNFKSFSRPFLFGKMSETPKEDRKEWYEKNKGVLGSSIDKVCIDRPTTLITNWLRSHQESVKDVLISKGLHEELKYFLNKVEVTELLKLEMIHYEKNFRLDIPEGSKRLFIRNAQFIKYQQFLKLKHQEIVLNRLLFRPKVASGFNIKRIDGKMATVAQQDGWKDIFMVIH